MSILPEKCNDCHYYSVKVCLHDHAHGVDVKEGESLPYLCPIKEDILDAKRYVIQYRDEKFYLVISHLHGKPWEVFTEHPTNMEPSVQYMVSGWDSMTRFVTMALKAYDVDKVVRQLLKASRQKTDLPGILASKLQLCVNEGCTK
jgi:hypothetical protein